MSALTYDSGSLDLLEKKFFDLVVQPSSKVDVAIKPQQGNAPKQPKKLGRRHVIDRHERRRFLIGNRKPEKKEQVKNVPLVVPPNQSTPLQILLTPNPSAVVLQCRIQQEVKDAVQKAILLKKSSKSSSTTDVNSSKDKLPSEATASMPQVIQLGLVGVFELINATASQHSDLCCMALKALLNVLQGQTLQGMMNEYSDLLDNLFLLLLDLARRPTVKQDFNDDPMDNFHSSLSGIAPHPPNISVTDNIPSLACSCLISLALAWGDTSKLLSVASVFLVDCAEQKDPLYIHIPSAFMELQRTVCAAVLSKDHIPTPLHIGIQESYLFNSWSVDGKLEEENLLCMQCDGSHLYCLFNNSVLMKIGTGYNSTVEGHVYNQRALVDLQSTSKSGPSIPTRLLYFEGALYVLTSRNSLYSVDRSDLSLAFLCDILFEENVWFCDGEGPCSISAIPLEDSYLIKYYAFNGGQFTTKEIVKVHPTKRHLLTYGKSLGYNPIKEVLPEKEHFEILQVLLGANFSLCCTDKGQVFFAGKSESLGLKGRSKKVVTPELLPLPGSGKITHISVASDGEHAILVVESGEVYFTGISHRGEDGDSSKNRRQSAQKPKLIKCMEGKHVVSGYCNAGTSALITKDGKLYMFGKDSTQADHKTGYVSALSDVHVKQVALGKAHVVILSSEGRLWTSGVNNRGQCGRQEGVLSMRQRIAEVELEKDVSMAEEKSIDGMPLSAGHMSGDPSIAPVCSPEKHKFCKAICVICAVCSECTGYGSSCVYSSVEGRQQGMPCGCGTGWSACSECGCCRTCAGEADVNADGKRKDASNVLSMIDPVIPDFAAVMARSKIQPKRIPMPNPRENKGPSKSEILKEANKMALLPLVEIQLPKDGTAKKIAVQIACGDHHTVVRTDVGEIYVFGKNNHGQLGLGDTNNRNQPTLMSLPYKVAHISTGSHHTILLTENGLLFGCGSNSHGQLGKTKSTDVLQPTLILPFQQTLKDVPRVSWVSASQTSTFVKYEEVLLNVGQLHKAKIFADSFFIGISYHPINEEHTEEKSNLLLINKHLGVCQHFHQDSISLSGNEQVCVDQLHGVLWRFDAVDWKVKSYLLCGYKCNETDGNLPFTPQLSVSVRQSFQSPPPFLDFVQGSLTTRTQAGLNLLSCIYTLITRCPNGMSTIVKDESNGPENGSTSVKKTLKSLESHSADDYSIVNRFKSHGGGWGYSVHSTEAIRFMVDTDILLGGVGVFGGRGEYAVTVSVYEELGESDVQGDGELLTETDRTPYECGFRERFHALFDEPLNITSGQWYTITCKVSGPSSDCGSHGEESVTTSDSIKFTFRRSKWSNNGTDVSAGQIPELLYSLPTPAPPGELEAALQPPVVGVVQIVSPSFYMSIGMHGSVLDSLYRILSWAQTAFFDDIRQKSIRYYDAGQQGVVPLKEKVLSIMIGNLSFIFTGCLRMLKCAVTRTLSSGNQCWLYQKNKSYIELATSVLTNGDIDTALENALLMPDQDRNLVISSAIAWVTECHMIMTECIEAFYPDPPKKWNYLHHALENYNKAFCADKGRMARLLAVVLDSLCQSSVDLVQCLPLFPRTLSNLTSLTSPSNDSSSCDVTSTLTGAGFYEVAYSLVEIASLPARVTAKIEKEQVNFQNYNYEGLETTFSKLLLKPQRLIVAGACKLLSNLTSDLAYRASDTSTLLGNLKNDKTLSSAMRFESTDNSLSWNCANGAPDAICFSVDTTGVFIGGFGIYGGSKDEHKYELEFSEQVVDANDIKKSRWETLDLVKGSYSAKEAGSDHIVTIKLNKSFPIKKNCIYAVRLRNHGDRTYCGERGKTSVKCDDGVSFIFIPAHQSTNGTSVTRGQIPSILYHSGSSPEEETAGSPGDKWVGTATTMETAGLAYQRHALNVLALVTEAAVEIFNSISNEELAEEKEVLGGDPMKDAQDVKKSDLKKRIQGSAKEILSSELVTHLLPQLFSNIGVLVRRSPHCAVEVVELIRSLLPPLINLQQISSPPYKAPSPAYSVVVESSHPYKQACVNHYKASFPPCVKWMLVEFSSKSQTAQAEDFLQLFLRKPHDQNTECETSSSDDRHLYPVLNKMTQEKNWPQNAVLLPGHDLVFVLETASDYTNSHEQKPHLFYGFRCAVTGYESVPSSEQEDGSLLVNELINITGLASDTLVKVHDQLWTDEDTNGGEISAEIRKDKTDHLKAIETTAAVTLQRHSALFLPGLHLDFFPSSSQALSGNLPISEGSKEKFFLQDFMTAAVNTAGGRLARWLQPDSYVDPQQCLLQLNTQTLIHTLPTSITIITRDQYGNPAFVPTLKVELSAKPRPSSHVNSDAGAPFDIPVSPGEPSPVFDARYEATKYRDSRYHSITMMRAYKKYSFEELRIAYPHKRTYKTENILVASVGNGVYRATWIPSVAANYTLQVTIDDQLKGPRRSVIVDPAPLGCSERPTVIPSPTPVIGHGSKLLKFATKNSRGLRIRSNPSLLSPQVGLLEYDDVIEFSEEIRNIDGNWVKLTKASAFEYCEGNIEDAWCISYHKHNGRTFLVPMVVATKKITEINKKGDRKEGSEPVSLQQVVEDVDNCKPSTSGSAAVPPVKFTPKSNPFSPPLPSKPDIFSSPFVALQPEEPKEWIERIPGEYMVIKCGGSGHNVRYNPDTKSPPVGKLVLGSMFTAVDIKVNKNGRWLLLHRTDVTRYCDDTVDEGHGWALAVSVENIYLGFATQTFNSINTSTPSLDKQEKTSTSNPCILNFMPDGGLESLENKFESFFPHLRNEALPHSCNGAFAQAENSMADLLVGTFPSPKDDDLKVPSQPKNLNPSNVNQSKQPEWKERVKSHHRSSSESDVATRSGSTSGAKSDVRKRGRNPRAFSQKSYSFRSHSNPSPKRASTTRNVTPVNSKIPSRRSLVERQTMQLQKNTKTEDKVPAMKVLRGGQKKTSNDVEMDETSQDGIPFIDDIVDAEGNILSYSPSEKESMAKPSKLKRAASVPHGKAKPESSTQSFTSSSRKPKYLPQKRTMKEMLEATKSKKLPEVSKALSPLVAECARAVFAAFLWHEGIVHDAMACASFLKFNQTVRSQIMKCSSTGAVTSDDTKLFLKRRSSNTQSPKSKEMNKAEKLVVSSSSPTQPPDTLMYLAMFWDQLSETVTKIAIRNQTLPIPTPTNQNLNCNGDKPPASPTKGSSRANVDAIANGYNEAEHLMKVPPLKRKALQRPFYPAVHVRRNMHQQQQMIPLHRLPYEANVAGDAGDHFKDTTCDLCDQVHPYPVTYHMKQTHPGCRKFAGGLGYNSSGHYCGGWAGDCGDGGVGGSTWYLLCVNCREKYMSKKNTFVPIEKSVKKPGGSWMNKLFALLNQPTSAHQVMKDNAMFLLNLVSASSGTPQIYDQNNDKDKTGSLFQASEGGLITDEVKLDDEKLWDETDLLPLSQYSHCPFPAIPCAYLTMHGKENGINNNIRPNPVPKTRSVLEYRNRSLSTQPTPSSGLLKHVSQRLSITPDSSPQKTEFLMMQRDSRLMRSVSAGSQPLRKRSCSGGTLSPSGASTGSFLLHNPSPAMKKLMRGRTGNSNDIARDAVHCSYVLPFVTERHDLKSLHLTMQMTLRRAALRVYVLQALTWLLRTVVSESSIHDILWYFVAALAGNTTNGHKPDPQKSAELDATDDEMEETKSIYDHPVKDMVNAGIDSMRPLVEAFHGFLQTVSDIMMDLPPNSPVQLMAIRCWSLRVLPSDHQFLHESKVFSHISQILSKVDGKVPVTKVTQGKLVKVKVALHNQEYVPVTEAQRDSAYVYCLRDLTAKAQIKTSSHSSIANSLTDGSTETFWESGDEDKNKPKTITIDMTGKPDTFLKTLVHIDNTRDLQKKVTSMVFWVDVEDEWVKKESRDFTVQYVGWQLFEIPDDVYKVKIELRGPDNGLRVRQIQILGKSRNDGEDYVEQLPAKVLRAQTCEAELLKVFKLLTAEVFGQLLSESSLKGLTSSANLSLNGLDKTAGSEVALTSSNLPSSPRDPNVDPNLREHMVGILFSGRKLSSLQKKVFEHTVQAIHTETARIRNIWESNLTTPHVPQQNELELSDTYCFELLSMILALSGSDVGCQYISQQNLLIEDFVTLLHTGTPRVQRQVTLLLRRILSEVTPDQLAAILSASIPTQDHLSESVMESSSSLTSGSGISVLHPFFACIAKSLSVQVKGTQDALSVSGEGDASVTIKAKRNQSVSLQAVFSTRPNKNQSSWWMHGSMPDQSIVEAVISLLTDMSAGRISAVWGVVTKCAVSEAILSLMKLSETDRDPSYCLKNPVLWHALASLCVLDRDHVDKLSSARSTQQKNKSNCTMIEFTAWPRVLRFQHTFRACLVYASFYGSDANYKTLQDKERTHIFTFLVENPQEISSFDVRSREFQFAGHRWYVYTGKPNNEYFSFYLRIVNLGKDVRVHTVYSFNVVNMVNYQNNYTYRSPPDGRIFSRDDDALSWGWKEFIRRETLLKPNGGFFFDGNKVLVELECKTYKTVFEENVELPKVTPEIPYPMIHTSPFSVGGFAWQIRIFPDGPDEDNKGSVALFLHCTTSNHLAKVKARFLIEGQPSPAVYEHTFPPNCISEMPSGVAFPNKGEFMNSLQGSQLKVGIEFMSVFEVCEIHVTLSDPSSCPTVCVTPFEDLTGCPWVLKTLQTTKLKLKLDQNEKTTSGLMEFYHRHIMWNATLVSPGSEDVSLNVPLNTKGPLIGYFGEHWSDADVIKSELFLEDLTLNPNPYRTDVDDGYERYSYVSIHVEIVSNHLLYKTPTPSPTGDRERKLLYNARKDRTQVHARYQDLLRQKALLASKCQNLTRERTRLIGVDSKEAFTQVVPDFSKFLSDVMLDLSERAVSKGKLQSLANRIGRPYHALPQPTESERQKKFALYREDFSLLLSDVRPDLSRLAVVKKYIDEFKDLLAQFIKAKAAMHVTNIFLSGSLGTNTICSNRWDVDLILMSPDLPRNGQVMWMPSFVVALAKMLEEGISEGKLVDCSDLTYTSYSVQLKHKDVDVDLYPIYDWNHEGGYEALYDELLKQRTSENLTWFCPAAASRQKLFVDEQPDQVKDLIKVVKFWRNAADWSEGKWRPSSYLLALLLVRAYESACHVVEDTLPSNRTVMKSFVKLVLSTGIARPAPLRIAWGRFYDPKDYNIEYSGTMSGECPPIVQDPANPANNVAERPVSWLPFRRMLELTCDNHDDGATPAIVQCSECGNLCSDCDRYLHLHKRTRTHHRQIFKEEEEAIRVNLHEGCGRIKLFWLMALADANTLKAIVEFKSRAPGQRQPITTGVCRFCGSSSDNGQLALSNVCSDNVCQQLAALACTRTHSCGHLCGGIRDEENCLKCLHSSCSPSLNQDADDMCMVCFTDALSAAPAIQLECGHIFHFECCQLQLKKQWAGPRITFGFMQCSICKTEIDHPSLQKHLKPIRDLMAEVEKKALQRLEYEGLNECESITTVGGRFYNDPSGFARSKYAYYMCYKCNKAYYGGEVRCDAEAGGEDMFDPKELICGACSDVACAQICPKHGTDFLEYKCRYCCSVAVYFCFGTTHFCQPCHDDFQRITTVSKSDLPHCPAGHKARQLEGKECPLHVSHPPTGEEFALGCGVCRNAHTF